MRIRPIARSGRTRLVSLAGALVLAAGPCWAQGSPSADSIINALKPTGVQGSTRGIRPAAPAAPSATQPAAATPGITAPSRPAAPTAPPAEAPSINLTVQFRTGSAELTPEAIRTLDELGRALSSPALTAYRFRIEGHTDTVGPRDLNQTLSQQRAARVAEYLESKFNVSAARLEAVGRGSQAPLVPTGDQVAEPRNRRVQVVNIGS